MKTTEQLLNELDAAKQATLNAEQDLRNAERAERRAYAEVIWHLHGVREGSVVKSKDGVFQVCEIRTYGGPKTHPSVSGFKQKKDGTFTDRRTFIGPDYEIVTA